MKHLKRGWIRRIIVLIVPIVIAVGCNGTPTPQVSVPLADLTTKEIRVQVSSAGDSETNLQKDGSINIHVDDLIRLDERGQAVLRVQDSVEADLFHKSEIQLADANTGSGGSIFVKLNQIHGQSRVRLIEGANAQLTLETEYATIKTLEQGTEFVVCHTPDTVTCVVVNKGVIEFTAQGKKEIVPAGESAYVFPGETPSSPICVQQDEFDRWFADLQASQEDRPLGKLVGGWPQDSCAALAQASPTSIPAALPAADGMIRIEAGLYTIGSPEPDDFHITQQEINLERSWIDVYETTNDQYQEFIQATGHPPPLTWPGEAQHPVRGVTWDAAAAYCDWANKRLPTEAEWEVAARGSDQDPPLYPWGADPLDGGQVSELPRDQTYAVGTFSFNQSPFGVYDMAGNVWEWVGEPYDDLAEGTRIVRGGRYGFIRDAAFRQPAHPDNERFVAFAGFRCVADQVQGE